MSDQIPTVAMHRGVAIHDSQPASRIQRVVKPAIDAVHAIDGVEALFDYAGNIANPPEARLFAAAKCEALFELAAEERRVRPMVDLVKLHARVCGLDSEKWRDPFSFCSLLDVAGPGQAGAERREERLP